MREKKRHFITVPENRKPQVVISLPYAMSYDKEYFIQFDTKKVYILRTWMNTQAEI